ncbi:hypothetical protein LC593_34930 [Nostoc sp. CHAB 5844]|nr:hypothetical protein [Nostoc sp. CHAB 5844]
MADICPFEPGAWHGRFYGRANAYIGSYMKTVADGVKQAANMYLLVIPATLTPPSAHRGFKSVVWFGAAAPSLTSGNVGEVRLDADPRLLMLSLKTTFSHMYQIVDLLRSGLVTDFAFEVLPDNDNVEVGRIVSWSLDCSFDAAGGA